MSVILKRKNPAAKSLKRYLVSKLYLSSVSSSQNGKKKKKKGASSLPAVRRNTQGSNDLWLAEDGTLFRHRTLVFTGYSQWLKSKDNNIRLGGKDQNAHLCIAYDSSFITCKLICGFLCLYLHKIIKKTHNLVYVCAQWAKSACQESTSSSF